MRGITFRLLPITIFVAALTLSVKVGGIWQTIAENDSPVGVAPVLAQTGDGPGQGFGQGLEQGFDQGFEPLDFPDGEIPEGMTEAATVEGDAEFGDVATLTPGELRLLHDLAKRRQALEQSEREIAEREALLRAAEQQLVVKQRQLEQIRGEIRDLIQLHDAEQQEEQERLRRIYSAIKPRAAAAIFNDLDMDTLLAVMRGMSPRVVAPILADMNPERARLLTRELAELRELPTLPQ